MDFRILGPLEALDEGRDVAPRRPKQRALLGLLLLHPNEPIGTDGLIEALWGDEPPNTAAKALHGHVSGLRKLLGLGRVRTERGGYRLEVKAGELDLDRFESALRAARTMTDPGDRAALLADALAGWRGEPLADLRLERFAGPEIARLEALRLVAQVDRADAELELGHHVELVPDLELLLGQHPLSERLRAQLMLALYRSGRQSEALHAYQDGRRILADELGIDPGAQLQALERQILAHDPALAPPADGQRAGASPRQERKVVTVLVAEASATGTTDPEDLQRHAGPVLERARSVIERHGGTPQPLFANAILGIFGAPRAHDDDALRAVGAALDLRDAMAGAPRRLRIGIETGEALVTLDRTGLSVTGNVLAVASQLQATAPDDAIIVGPAAHRATASAIDFLEDDAGRWVAAERRQAMADATPEAPLIGREDELAVLERAFARARDESSVQLVTVTAEPGGGKSRLVRELRELLDRTADPPAWRQGRCLPYGEGVTYWALGEVVKAHAGILESDDSEASARKLSSAIAGLEPDETRQSWLERSLAALLGIEGATASGDREQAFAVWRQFLEAIAVKEPLVVVFEDIHWADAALLEFVDHLVSHASGVPMLVLCTARLELLEARPGWGGGKRNAATIALEPLSDAETERILHALLGRAPRPATIRRAGGNPLFAHELALIVGRGASEDAVTIPESLHAVIAARLDTLPPELKALAADAAVVGDVFWSGALAAMAGIDEREVEERLYRLVANDVARRRRTSAVTRQSEFSFRHVLVRDVAYGQIPRRDRVTKHQAASAWIERLAGDRIAEHAELIAYHAVQALEAAAGSADTVQTRELELRARRFLALAGEHVQRLDVVQAEQFFQRALDLTPDGDAERGRLLSRLADVAQYTGRLVEAEQLCEAAIAELQAHGDRQGAGEAMVTLSVIRWRLGRSDEDRRRPVEAAIGILEALTPGKELVQAYARLATHEIQGGRAQACRDWSLKALAVANDLGVAWLRNQPLQYLGIAKFELGDLSGIDDMREALAIGLETGLSWETATGYSDLADPIWLTEGPAAALALKRTSAEFAHGRGLTWYENTVRADMQWLMLELGAWDELLAAAKGLIAWDREHGASRVSMGALTTTARVLALRGRAGEAAAIERDYLAPAQAGEDPQDLVPALATAAMVRHGLGDTSGAVALIAQLEAITRDRDVSRRVQELPVAVRILVAGNAVDLAEELAPRDAKLPFWRGQLCVASGRAMVAEAQGDFHLAEALYASTAQDWGAFGSPVERAYSLLGEGRSLVALGRPDEARARAAGVRRIAARLKARPLMAEAEALAERASERSG
ncbi:MAG: hypothetical protein EPO36_07515 [Chloroflexota bacterium]|nr:MAG: hypothetical protein EPO36_07515 [Chloroflexota bacterium]